jgi:hypothetical protein
MFQLKLTWRCGEHFACDDMFFGRMVVKDEYEVTEKICEFLKCTCIVLNAKQAFLDELEDVSWNNHLSDMTTLYCNKYYV